MVKQFKVVFVRCLLFFYLTSAYLSATHIHNDALESHSDCKICIVVKNLNSGDNPNSQISNPAYILAYELIPFRIDNIICATSKGFNANAPPLFSL